jgi:hypothetical protein
LDLNLSGRGELKYQTHLDGPGLAARPEHSEAGQRLTGLAEILNRQGTTLDSVPTAADFAFDARAIQ